MKLFAYNFSVKWRLVSFVCFLLIIIIGAGLGGLNGMRSVNQSLSDSVIVALLTGMNRDGVEGLIARHNHNRYTIAQDRDSSIVYGMTRLAAQINAGTDVLPARRIGWANSSFLHVKTVNYHE